jgi:hypothetical protein
MILFSGSSRALLSSWETPNYSSRRQAEQHPGKISKLFSRKLISVFTHETGVFVVETLLMRLRLMLQIIIWLGNSHLLKIQYFKLIFK